MVAALVRKFGLPSPPVHLIVVVPFPARHLAILEVTREMLSLPLTP